MSSCRIEDYYGNKMIADGKVHVLSKDFAYIAKIYDENLPFDGLEEKKYFEKAFEEYLGKDIKEYMKTYSPEIDSQIIYRPNWESDCLKQKSCMIFKFKRKFNDGLHI